MKTMTKRFCMLLLTAILYIGGCGLLPDDTAQSVGQDAVLYSAGMLCNSKEISSEEIPENVRVEIEEYLSEKKYSTVQVVYGQSETDIYYGSLSLTERDCYNQLCNQISNDHPYAIIKAAPEVTKDSFRNICYAYIMSDIGLENYELWASYSYIFNYGGNNVHYVEYERVPCDRKEFSRMLEECTGMAAQCQRVDQKLECIYRYLVENITYDHDMSNLENNQTAGSVTNKKTVCSGYAKMLALACSKVGIRAHVVTTAMHAFNYVYIDGAYYIADATWDINSSHTTKPSREDFRWFLVGQATRDRNDVDNQHTNFSGFTGEFVRLPSLSLRDYVVPAAELGSETENTPLPIHTPEPTASPISTPVPLPSETPESTTTPSPTTKPTEMPEQIQTPSPTVMPSEEPISTITPIQPTEEPIEDSDEGKDDEIYCVSVIRDIECYVGDPIVDESFSVEVTYHSGETRTLLPGEYSVEGGNTTVAGETTYLVRHKGWTVTCTLTVKERQPEPTQVPEKEIVKMSVIHDFDCTQFDVITNDFFTVEIFYSDATSRILSSNEFTVVGNTNEIGEVPFTVIYTDVWTVIAYIRVHEK